MYCGKCGSQINDGLSSCPNCGASNKSVGQPPMYTAQPVTFQQPITLTQAEPVHENGFAIAGLIISLLSFPFCIFNYVNIAIPCISLVFSLIGVCMKNAKRKGMAIAGIIISAIMLIAGFGISFS